MTGTWQDFSGLDNLTGFDKTVGTVLLKNELGGISNGYELRHADGTEVGGNSGYSFGGNQLDLANNTVHASAILRDILVFAVDGNDDPIIANGGAFYDSHQLQIEAQGNPFALLTADKTLINQALASDYGRFVLNLDFVDEVQTRIADVNTVINALPAGNVKTTIQQSEEL